MGAFEGRFLKSKPAVKYGNLGLVKIPGILEYEDVHSDRTGVISTSFVSVEVYKVAVAIRVRDSELFGLDVETYIEENFRRDYDRHSRPVCYYIGGESFVCDRPISTLKIGFERFDTEIGVSDW